MDKFSQLDEIVSDASEIILIAKGLEPMSKKDMIAISELIALLVIRHSAQEIGKLTVKLEKKYGTEKTE